MNNLLLDTNILIYLLQGNEAVREILEDKVWFISFVTEMELLMKPDMASMELKAVNRLLDECIIIGMSDTIKAKAIDNARTHKTKLADSLVLATAQTSNMMLLTADTIFKRVAQTSNDVLLFIP